MEALEDRRMLSAIVWMNRYTFDGTDDNHFDEAFNIPLPFGAIDTTKRDEAIAVVDAVILKWERVINSFNYVSPSTAFQVNISMTAAAQGIGPGALTANTPQSSIGYTDGKPSSAAITIGWRTGLAEPADVKGGWYLDPTPNDLGEFLATNTTTAKQTNAFFGLTPNGTLSGVDVLDLFSTVEHELGHAVGLYSNNQTLMSPLPATALQGTATKTNTNDFNNMPLPIPNPFYWRVDTTNVHTLWTGWDAAQDDNGPGHFADAGASVTVAGRTYLGANGLMNAQDRYHGRKLIDDTIATILQDVYGYTIQLPSSFGTFYDWLDTSGRLHIQTPAGGADQVALAVVGSSLQVTLNLGNPVAGIDPSTIVSTFALSSITSIDIKTGNGNDTITLSPLGASIPITMDMDGDGSDTLHIQGTGGVDHVQMGFTNLSSTNLNVSYPDFSVNKIDFTTGFDASDSLTFDNHLGSASSTYGWFVEPDRLTLLGGVLAVYTTPFGSISCVGGAEVDQVYFQGNRDTQSFTFDTGDGNDVITVGYSPGYIALHGPLTIRAGAGSDVIVWNTVVNSIDGTTYPVSVDGGSGYNAMSIDETLQNIPAQLEFYDIYDNRIVMSDNADFTYDNMQAMTLQCSPNSGTVKVHGTSSDLDLGNQFGITGTPGMSTFIVYPHDAAGNLTINGNLAIGGSTSTSDNLTIDDTASSFPITYTFANTYGPGTTNIYGMGSAAFGGGANIETITVKGSSGGNTFNVSSFKSGSALKVYGGLGNDTLNFGASNLATDITSIGEFLFDGQNGSDTFSINNAGSSSALTYTQGSGLVSVTGGSPVYSLSDASVEKLVINAGSVGDNFYVNAVPSGSQTILNGNAGLDGLGLGFASFNLDAIQGVVTYNTGADAGNLAAVDTADTTGDIVHLTTTSLGAAAGDTLFGPGGALYFDNIVNFNTFPGVTLNLGSGADTVFAQPLPSARVTINGNNPTASPGDALQVNYLGVTSPAFASNGTGAGTYTFANAAALNYTGFESVAAGVPGDSDLNGTVATADYNLWKSTFGNQVTPFSGGDSNGNGVIDAADYTIWRDNLGKHSPGAGSGSEEAVVVASSAPSALEVSDRQQAVKAVVFAQDDAPHRKSTEGFQSFSERPAISQSSSRQLYLDQLLLEFKPSAVWFPAPATLGGSSSHEGEANAAATAADGFFAAFGDDCAANTAWHALLA
jgi:hypothetical protein